MRVSGVRIYTLFHADRIQWVACPSPDYAYHLRDCASLSVAYATERLIPQHPGKIKLLTANVKSSMQMCSLSVLVRLGWLVLYGYLSIGAARPGTGILLRHDSVGGGRRPADDSCLRNEWPAVADFARSTARTSR